MKRIIEPLQLMGADIDGRQNQFAPLTIKPGKLQRFEHKLKLASAQVKSCLLLAGLFSDGETTVFEPAKSRDHTERMMEYLGADISVQKNSVSIQGFPSLKARHLTVPGDISSAAFFLVAASIIKNSNLTIKNVGMNASRTGILDVLKMMGADFKVNDKKINNNEESVDIDIYYNQLIGIEIGGELIPRIIDEIPVLAIAATQAEGQTIIKDANELRVKETDRITAVVKNLKKMGASITEASDGMIIEGKQKLYGAEIDSFGDHRIAMAFAILGLRIPGIRIRNPACVNKSFSLFWNLLSRF
jgi:3-phosphoshikimate 1-carboxyvinyltransferase